MARKGLCLSMLALIVALVACTPNEDEVQISKNMRDGVAAKALVVQ